MCIGGVAEVVRTVSRFQAIGLDQLVMIPVIGWNAEHEAMLASVELLGEKVLPEFR